MLYWCRIGGNLVTGVDILSHMVMMLYIVVVGSGNIMMMNVYNDHGYTSMVMIQSM